MRDEGDASSSDVKVGLADCAGVVGAELRLVSAQHGLPVVVEARLAEVMDRGRAAIGSALVPLVSVGPELAGRLGEIRQGVETALSQLRLELIALANECVELRLRRVELLHDMQIRSLQVEEPLFKV